jgi:hypothetical protein
MKMALQNFKGHHFQEPRKGFGSVEHIWLTIMGIASCDPYNGTPLTNDGRTSEGSHRRTIFPTLKILDFNPNLGGFIN